MTDDDIDVRVMRKSYHMADDTGVQEKSSII